MDNRDNRDDIVTRETHDASTTNRLDSTSKDFVSHADTGGEQVLGGVGGAAVGAAWGTLAGPIGTIIGGLAGAVGGWWAARSATEQHMFSADDDTFYRSHYDRQRTGNTGVTNMRADTGTADMGSVHLGSADMAASTDRSQRSYDDVRPAYQLGHLAGANPDYTDRSFDDVEPQLRSAYSTSGQNDWDDVRGYAQDAYSRGRTVGTERSALGTSDTAAGTMGDATTGTTHSTMNTTGNRGTMSDAERTLRGNEGGIADRVADAADDLKDRVDGNPASRPGRDATDRPGR